MLRNSGVGLQDDVSNPGVPFACGLTLEKLSAHTVDEAGNEAFVKDNPLSLLRKVSMGSATLWYPSHYMSCKHSNSRTIATSIATSIVTSQGFLRTAVRGRPLLQASKLRRFAAYFDVGKPLWQPKKAWMDMLAYDWDQLFKQGIAGETATAASRPPSPQADAAQRMYIVSPIDGQLQYLRRGKNVRQGEAKAIQEADFHLQSITFHVSSMCTEASFSLCCIEFQGNKMCYLS